MRQRAMLFATLVTAVGVVLHVRSAVADRPTIWVSDPASASGEDDSMTVYPLQFERRGQRTSFNALQRGEDELIPPPVAETPDVSSEAAPPIDSAPEPSTPATRRNVLRAAPPESGPPRITEGRSGPDGIIAEEVLPPSDGILYDYGDAPPAETANIPVSAWDGEPPAAVWSSGEWFRSGVWYTNVDFLVVRRDRPRNRLLIGVDLTNPNHLFFNYGGTAGVEPAMRLTLGRFVGRDWKDRDHSVETSFLGINEFKTGQGIRAQTQEGLILLLDQKQGGINGADVWTTDYSSRFYSIETDLRLRHRPDKDRLVMAPDGTWTRQYTSSYIPSLLLGVRYLNLNEDYLFRSRSLAENITRAEFGADYDIETRNDLIGLQVGGDFINQRESWYWGVRGKAGAYINFAEQDSIAQFNDLRAPGPDAPGDPSIDIAPRVEHASRANEAFFGELSLMAAYHFTPNFTARASYDFMWLAGVALAPDQFTFAETARLSLDGVIFYQGLSLGFEVVW
jgi:hypothetical protein